MSFFESEIVKNEIKTTTTLVELFNSHDLSDSDRSETLQACVDKLRIFYARLGFSDDEEANELKNELNRQASLLGFSNMTQCLNWLQSVKVE